jgi:hypothetical protein
VVGPIWQPANAHKMNIAIIARNIFDLFSWPHLNIDSLQKQATKRRYPSGEGRGAYDFGSSAMMRSIFS